MVLRFLASISLISIYLAMAVGGDVFHKLQHVVVDGVCSGHSAGNTPSCGEETQDTCSHAHAEHKTELSSENEYLLGTSFPGKDNQNNRSSDCWTCYVVSQAGDTPFEITVDTCQDFIFFIVATYSQLHVQPNPRHFCVREPPEPLCPQS